MGRPAGSRNKPGSLKPGRRKGCTSPILPQYKDEEIRQFKAQINELFEKGEVENLSQAADRIGVSKMRAYSWLKADAQWAEDIKLGLEVVADKYEEELLKPELKKPQVTALIFMLNGMRPEKYRDSYKLVAPNLKLEALLAKLVKAKGESPKIIEAEVIPIEEAKSLPQLLAETIESKDALKV